MGDTDTAAGVWLGGMGPGNRSHSFLVFPFTEVKRILISMTSRSYIAVDRDRAIKDLCATIRELRDATLLSEVRNAAERLQHQAFDLKDWAARNQENLAGTTRQHHSVRWADYREESD